MNGRIEGDHKRDRNAHLAEPVRHVDNGVGAERLYFDIERVGNTSSASIPIAIYDAVREGVIDRPMRIFAPGFGAGAVAGYVVARIDPAIVAI